MDGRMLVLDPVAPCNAERRQQRKVLGGLTGKVVGFIDNAKPNFNHLVDDVAELLLSKYGVVNVVKRRKSNSGSPAPESVMKELVSQCDAVITGSGD